MRVCLDTNVLVAAFATRGLCADVLRHVVGRHELVLPELVVEELRRVLEKKLRLSSEALAAVEAFLQRFETVPPPAGPAPLPLEDEEDRWGLAGALASQADVFVTGDRAILEHAADADIPIVTPRPFWELSTGSSA